MIELIVFDAVGTVLHPAEPVSLTYKRILTRFGIESDEQTLKAQFKTSFVKHFEPVKVLTDSSAVEFAAFLMDNPGCAIDRQRISNDHKRLIESIERVSSTTNEGHQKQCWQNVVNDCVDCFAAGCETAQRTAIFESLWHHFEQSSSWCVDPSLGSWISACQRYKIPWVVASNFDSRLSHVAAGHSAFDSCEKIYDSASLGYQKPDHRFYRVIEADFQLPTNRILMIGDNAIGDFIAPKILGWQAYWLSQNSTFVLEHLLESFRQGTSIDI